MKKAGMKMASWLMALCVGGAALTACGGAKPAETTAAPSETTAAETTAAQTTAAAAETPAETKTEAEPSAAETEAAEEEEENYETGDASLDDPRNGDEIGEKELLVVSFGTSFNDSRRLTIGAVEEALESAERNGVKTLVVQPTHLMNGFEYTDLSKELAGWADAFEKIAIGEPLLTSDEDFSRVADALIDVTKEYDDGETAICFMGHGTEAESNGVYARMQEVLSGKGMEHYYVGTVEAEPSLEDVLEAVKKGSYKRVVLRPMMIVAGDHANNDMAGDEEDSWKSVFEGAGYEVVCVVEGLGGIPAVQEILTEHAQAAADSVK